ncbi:MAG: hypothetical protein NTW52_05800 [Planctomycetota bacterium]|nr:hypothetical protein [Planctomycetota bacterium]
MSLMIGLGTMESDLLGQSVSEGVGIAGTDVNTATEMLDLNSVELRVQLQNGLRVFLPEQQEFLDRVLLAVDNGQLPRAMVNMVYVWSQRRNKKVPFPYFEFAMRTLAERRGVTL